jgi:site-specific recombinase XerD
MSVVARKLGSAKGEPPANKGRRFPAEPLTPEEAHAIIGACSAISNTGIRNRALLTLLYRSGLRISEALALRPSDVNLRQHSIRVIEGKGGKTTTRGFHPSADDALARWIETRKKLGVKNGPLFCTLDGGPVYPQYVRLLLSRLAEKAGVEKRVHPHGLRHTFAVELERAGTPVTVVSKLLGHSSVAVTSRYLDHLSNHQAVSALETVELPPL